MSNRVSTGFERPPEGKLLQQIVELSTPLGIAYERAIGFSKRTHVHERHMVVCPRSSCRFELEVTKPSKKFVADATKVIWVPKGTPHADSGNSVIYDTMALFIGTDFFEAMIKDNGLDTSDRHELESKVFVLKKTKWLDDILDRYFFERILNCNSPPGCTFFLEKQIINELARITFHKKLQQIWGEEEKSEAGSDPIAMTIRFIEANIFDKLTLEQLVTVAKVSESTLLRRFKEQLKQTPYDYIKNRRLDEALHLVKSGNYRVGDVSLLVGYEDFSSFSKAFKKKFGVSPSAKIVKQV